MIEKLEGLTKNSQDIQNNDDLFNLILEQRFKINELVEYIQGIQIKNAGYGGV